MRWKAESPIGRLNWWRVAKDLAERLYRECNAPAWVCLLLMLAPLAGCAGAGGAGSEPQSQRFEYMRVCMGVPTRIVMYGGDAEKAEEAAAAAFHRISELDAVMSDYRADSDLNRLCRDAVGVDLSVRHELYDILEQAAGVSRASGGAFDITVGPAVALWRRARSTGMLPGDDEVADARSRVNWEFLTLDPANRTVRLARDGMKLDLGGIAKGYAAQRAVGVLRARGFERVMVGLAGDIVAAEPPPGLDGWRVAVVGDRQQDRAEAPGRLVLLLRNAAVSTSGDAEQAVEVGGTRYSHIVDPQTALGMTAIRSVTVVAPTGEEADALSTAACLLGPQKGAAFLNRWGGVAAIVEEAGERTVVDPQGVLRFAPNAAPNP